MESIHDKLSRVRKPRVHITYDVETEGAMVKKELPFVVGVMGDFSGNNNDNIKPLKDRRFIQIDRDNFDDVLRRMSPKLKLKVDNRLTDDGWRYLWGEKLPRTVFDGPVEEVDFSLFERPLGQVRY